MATLLDIGKSALGELVVLAEGETPDAGQGALILSKMNDLIDQWAAERLTIYTITRTATAITASDGTYTVGSGGDINIVWPVYIDRVAYQDTSLSSTTEFPLTMLTEEAWQRVPIKTLTAARPTFWYYNPTHPLGTLELHPVPTDSNLQTVVYHPTAVTEFTATSDTVALPPGYRRMLIKNLAVEMASSFGREPSSSLTRAAKESKTVVKRMNKRPRDMVIEAAALGESQAWYDINVGP